MPTVPGVLMQGEKDSSRSDLEAANVSADHLGGPKFKFWVSDRHTQKLDYARATALLFTLNLVFGTEVGALQNSLYVIWFQPNHCYCCDHLRH